PSGLDALAHELLHEERVAGAEAGDERMEGSVGGGAEKLPEKRFEPLAIEGLEQHLLAQPRADELAAKLAERRVRRRLLRAVGEKERNRLRARRVGQVAGQGEARRIGPVEVLEHEQEAGRASQGAQV